VGRVADRGARVVVDAVGDETLEPGAGRVDDAECGVARARQLGGKLGQALKQALERQLGGQRHTGLEQGSQPRLAR
jgi:hypothetical protein